MPLFLPGGERVDLGAVANFRVMRGARTIERINRLTSVMISGNLEQGSTLNTVQKGVEARLAGYSMPAGYSWKLGRGFESEDEAGKTMLFNLLLAIAMIYLVMAAVFESTILPVSIITSILMAIIGVLWFLFVTRTTFTFMALIGMQILIGVVVNIGIVLVAHINDLRAAGMERLPAIVQAATRSAAPDSHDHTHRVAGIAAARGSDSLRRSGSAARRGVAGPSYAPMARAIMGGLLFGAVTSLFVVPAFYVWLDKGIAATRRFLAKSDRRVESTQQNAEQVPGIFR